MKWDKPVPYKRRTRLAKGKTRRRDEDLDPQLVWRGKDQLDWSDLIVPVQPLYVQEKIDPKALIEDLQRPIDSVVSDWLTDRNGIDKKDPTQYYRHGQDWHNRLILGDSLQVLASLAEREALSGRIQCIYFDPPYGIRFRSNWQVSTRNRDVKPDRITREPEQVKAFRDTWKDGIHSYLTYLRDRLTVMRALLTESGSIFVQIGDANVHRVRAVMDEVFGATNHICTISIQKTGNATGNFIQSNVDYAIWFGKDKARTKFRPLFLERDDKPSRETLSKSTLERDDFRIYPLTSDGPRNTTTVEFAFEGQIFHPGANRHWGVTTDGLARAGRAGRIIRQKNQIGMRFFWDDYPVQRLGSIWNDVRGATGKIYVVQTSSRVVGRFLLMTTDPGDLVLDPTCGSGTTACVAEQWGRRWITIDTSRVALALARTRLMAARYPYYLLADSKEGRQKEAELTGKPPTNSTIHGDIKEGFVCKRVPRITLKSIARNAEIDTIWEKYQEQLEPLRKFVNKAQGQSWEEWEIPRNASSSWPDTVRSAHADWWVLRIARQNAIDNAIAQRADIELLHDRPYEGDAVRVTGPFTVESLFPHRPTDNDNRGDKGKPCNDFARMVLENLKSAGVHQMIRDGRITFSSLEFWPGIYIAAEGHFMEGATGKRAAIFIGPEFATITRANLIAAASEAHDARFDVLIACGFHFDADPSDLPLHGKLPILKARMNPDLHMARELKQQGGNLFVVFGEPDIGWTFDGNANIVVEMRGIDMFDPKTGMVRASGKDDIAVWFIDTNYDGETFFVRHVYFLGRDATNDPYKSLATSLRASIDKEAWQTLYRDRSRPFARPVTGRFAVKAIDHFGNDVVKSFET